MKRQTKKLAAGAAAAAAGIAAATAVRHVTKKREQSAQSMVSSGREGERQGLSDWRRSGFLIGSGLPYSGWQLSWREYSYHGRDEHPWRKQ